MVSQREHELHLERMAAVQARESAPPARLSLGKSFSATAASWKRGDDMVDAQGARMTVPYAQSGWVFAAINLVSGEFTGLPVKFYDGDSEFEDASFAAWWEEPALGNDGKRLGRAAVDRLAALYWQLHGEYFLLLDDSWVVTAGRKTASFAPFIVARPDRIRLVIRAGKLEGYVYTDPAGRQVALVPEQVIHRMEPNPYDDWRGISRADIAKVAIEGAFLTGVYIRDLMRNNGDQGFIVVGKSGVATDQQRDQIVADLRAKRAALRAGVAKDLFLTGEITVDRPKEQAAGVDLTNTKILSHQEIFITFGVPPSMSTVKQSYSVGKESDRYQLITGTSQPLAHDIAGAYAELGRRQTGRRLTAEHDWDEHPVMQEVRRARLDAAIKLWSSGMPWKDVNDYLDLGMKPFPGWDIPYMQFSIAPVGSAKDPAQDPALAEPAKIRAVPLQPEVAQLQALLATRVKIAQPVADAVTVEKDLLAMFACNCGCGCITQKADRPPSELAQWRAHMVVRRETVRSFESAFTRVLMQARIETLRKIESSAKASATKAAAADLLFDLAKFTASMREAMEKQHRAGLQKAGEQLVKELGHEDPFTMAPAKVLEFLRSRENRMRDVPQDVYDQLKGSMEEGLQAGESTADLAKRVKAEFNQLSDTEARRVALSETAAVYGDGRQAAMQEVGVPYKGWLTSGNANVRPAHAEANGQVVKVDEPFIVDGEELMNPGASTGSAGNVINCHCVSVAKAGPE